MKSIVKKLMIGFIAIFVLLIAFIVIGAKINNRSIAGHLGHLSARLWLVFGNNSTLKINYTGVLDSEGNIAASGTSIPINAKTIEGYDLGIIGSLSNGTLSIVIPTIPKEALDEYDDGIMYELLYIEEIELENDEGDYINFWFFSKPTSFDGFRTVKGWNLIPDSSTMLFYKLDHAYNSGFKWFYLD